MTQIAGTSAGHSRRVCSGRSHRNTSAMTTSMITPVRESVVSEPIARSTKATSHRFRFVLLSR